MFQIKIWSINTLLLEATSLEGLRIASRPGNKTGHMVYIKQSCERSDSWIHEIRLDEYSQLHISKHLHVRTIHCHKMYKGGLITKEQSFKGICITILVGMTALVAQW